MAVFSECKLAPEIHFPKPTNLNPPALDLSIMSIQELALVEEFFSGVSEAALAYCNQPRFEGPSGRKAGVYADKFWEFLNRLWDSVSSEIESRSPMNFDEARARADVLIRHMVQCDDYAGIAAIAASLTEAEHA